MARSDFRYIPVNHTFTANDPSWDNQFPVELDPGEAVSEEEGYLLVTARSVDSQNHEISINGQNMSGFDIPLPPGNSDAWLTYMDRIGGNVLHGGLNQIRITRMANDDFVVKDLVVHWRKG
jgi:hypothetical protein